MVTEPSSMDDVIYFTRRTVGDGSIMAWTYKKECPKCKKAKMGKPVEKGKVKIRAKEYICPECSFAEEKAEHEAGLIVEVKYTCPHCGKSGETTTSYKRKTFDGVPAQVFTCNDCHQKIGITKKMKAGKSAK